MRTKPQPRHRSKRWSSWRNAKRNAWPVQTGQGPSDCSSSEGATGASDACMGGEASHEPAAALLQIERRAPRSWVEPLYNVQRWVEMPAGGHFPGVEQPDLLVSELRTFFGANH